MKFVATKTVDQLDLQAMHRVRERLVSQRTGIINQIRAPFCWNVALLFGKDCASFEASCRASWPGPSDALLSPRMEHLLEDLAGDWRRLDERIEGLSNEIEVIAD